jgi:hypothetical protein
MLDAGRSDTTAYISSEVQIIPTEYVLDGTTNFAITIQAAGHGEVNRAPRAEMPQPPAAAAGAPKKPDVPVGPAPSK